MTDWREYVRRHLPPLGVAPERAIDIVDELARRATTVDPVTALRAD